MSLSEPSQVADRGHGLPDVLAIVSQIALQLARQLLGPGDDVLDLRGELR